MWAISSPRPSVSALPVFYATPADRMHVLPSLVDRAIASTGAATDD